MKLFPSLFACTKSNMADAIKALEPYVDGLHIDIADGYFVPTHALSIRILYAVKQITNMPLQIHLMVRNPLPYITYLSVNSTDTIIIHCEIDFQLQPIIAAIRTTTACVALAINPTTDIKTIVPYLPLIDSIVVMGVQPGASGQQFIPKTVQTIMHLKELLMTDNRDITLIVDGGMNAHTVAQVQSAGATDFVIGSALFAHHTQADMITFLQELKKSPF